jgi:hypothetical protein
VTFQLTVYNPGGASGRIATLYWAAPLPWGEPVDHCALSGPMTVSTTFVTGSFHAMMTCAGATATTPFSIWIGRYDHRVGGCRG